MFNVPARKIKIIPNGVNEYFFHDISPGIFREYSKIHGPFVLHVGRFDPVKNHKTIINACAELQCQVVFIGDANIDQLSYARECRELAQKLQSQDSTGHTRYYFFNAFHNDDLLLRSAYASASVFVLPSHFETFGISALEAALAGTPLILSHNMSSKDIFQAYAKFVSPNSVSELKTAINDSMAEQKRITLNLREDLMNKYSWDSIAKNLEDAYLSLC
ncbi:MAG: glycosyltransferase [Deltaproteobacteria bacterium]|nr:glycosyltransferase [Deltaproteobacteria bacterium]